MIRQSTVNERVASIDALRGFALLGILLANIPFRGEIVPITESSSILTFIFYLFIDKKFITIFSILFGLGFYIQLQRLANKNSNFKKYFIIRMLLLFLIGCLHAYLIWFGDIVRAYAVGGIILLVVRYWTVKRLLLVGLIFIVLITGIIFIGNNAFGWQVYSYDYNLAKELLTTDSYIKYLSINCTIDPWMNFRQDMPLTLSLTFGSMLLGMVLGKISFFTKPNNYKRIMNWFMVLGGTLGVFGSYLFYLLNTGKLAMDFSKIWLPFLIIICMLLQSFCYISLFIRLYENKKVRSFLQFFNPIGRMALTNYVLQSALYLLVFFHAVTPLKLYGKLSLAETYLVAILFFSFQSFISYYWLKKYKQGPIERMWKKIAYKFV